jgi:hypothetical protein
MPKRYNIYIREVEEIAHTYSTEGIRSFDQTMWKFPALSNAGYVDIVTEDVQSYIIPLLPMMVTKQLLPKVFVKISTYDGIQFVKAEVVVLYNVYIETVEFKRYDVVGSTSPRLALRIKLHYLNSDDPLPASLFSFLSIYPLFQGDSEL